VINSNVMKSAISKVTGAGQIANKNGSTVLNGLIIISGGKHEIGRGTGASTGWSRQKRFESARPLVCGTAP
jgi:hypothetical protein